MILGQRGSNIETKLRPSSSQACLKIHFKVGSYPYYIVLEVNPCKFGTKKCEMDISKESLTLIFKVLCSKLWVQMLAPRI